MFDKEDVLQETIIIKVEKTKQIPEKITITSSQSNNDFDNLTSLTVPYSLVVSGDDYYVYLVTDEKEDHLCWKDYIHLIKHCRILD